MTEFQQSDITPVFEALGAAVFEAQHLERGLFLLITLMDEKSGQGKSRDPAPLDRPEAPKTIGLLFREVRMRKYLIDAEKKAISDGVRERNGLIHSYWNGKRTPALMTPAGRAWLVNDLDRIRGVCYKAGRIVDSIVDRYLKDYGASLDGLSSQLLEIWEPGSTPPPEVLH
jgi:hypothetical protein